MGAGHVVSFPRVCQKLRMHSASDHENPHKISFFLLPPLEIWNAHGGRVREILGYISHLKS